MSNLQSFADSCWDSACPMTNIHMSIDEIKKKKLECLNANKNKICECCLNRGVSKNDCCVTMPGEGLLSMCGEECNSGMPYTPPKHKNPDYPHFGSQLNSFHNNSLDITQWIIISIIMIILIVLVSFWIRKIIF